MAPSQHSDVGASVGAAEAGVGTGVGSLVVGSLVVDSLVVGSLVGAGVGGQTYRPFPLQDAAPSDSVQLETYMSQQRNKTCYKKRMKACLMVC